MADLDETVRPQDIDAVLSPRNEDGDLNPSFVALITDVIEAEDGARAIELAGDLHESDLGALLEALDPDARPRLIGLMGKEFDFAALTEVDDHVREEILEELPNETVAEGVRELENDDALTILEDLDAEDQKEILDALPVVDRASLRRSLDYADGSAGRLMQTTLVTAPDFWTVGEAIDFLRDTPEADLPDSFFEVFVVDPAHRLLGNVFLDVLVRSQRAMRLADIMQPDRRRVDVGDEEGEVARLFERYNLVSVPVVDDGGRLVGVITIDDIVDVMREEADDNLKALGGVSASEELSDTVWWTSRSRFPWLLVNLVTAFAASLVLWFFEGQIEKMVALAVLAPIVASQGGNAATQTMTVAVRALATRELTHANAMRVVVREALVGLFNGLAFGVITGVVAGYWFGLPGLGVCIGLAMLTNLLAAALGGLLIPLVHNWFDIDPAVASGAFVTTVTDVIGYFSFLAIATFWFALW